MVGLLGLLAHQGKLTKSDKERVMLARHLATALVNVSSNHPENKEVLRASLAVEVVSEALHGKQRHVAHAHTIKIRVVSLSYRDITFPVPSGATFHPRK
eukprot:9475296-Pyramimonas_sp.AAC.3